MLGVVGLNLVEVHVEDGQTVLLLLGGRVVLSVLALESEELGVAQARAERNGEQDKEDSLHNHSRKII